MTIISPSVLACDFLNIEAELKALENIPNLWLHLDIMDGHFVPNLTFGHPIIEKICKKTLIKCDAHFMVTNPEFHVESLTKAGLHNFTFHLEATSIPLELARKIKAHYPSCGVSIKPKTPVSALSDELLKCVDLVLVMSVEPGFGGQSFMPSAFDKIKLLIERKKSLNTSFSIQVDGGVTDQNSNELLECGADNLVAGSFVFKNGPQFYSSQIEKLR